MQKDDATKADGCRRCGECCKEMGSPPFMPRSAERAAILEKGLCAEGLDFPEDMPEELINEHLDYLQGEIDGTIESRGAKDMPCSWLDEEKMLCKHYEFRPGICREHSCPDADAGCHQR